MEALRHEFLILGCFWVAVFVFASPIYDIGTNILKWLEWNALADLRDRAKKWVLPVIRVILVAFAIASFVAAFAQ